VAVASCSSGPRPLLPSWTWGSFIFVCSQRGRAGGNGWLDTKFAGADLFVMPGPYESKATSNLANATLAERLRH